MMKKLVAFSLTGLLVLSLAGCGSGKKAEETTAPAASVPESEELTENTVGATVQKLDGTKLSVELDDGQSMTFDIANAATNPAWELMPGDEVNISYQGSEPTDGMAVESVEMSVPYEFESSDFTYDDGLYGIITAVDDKSISIQQVYDGREEEASTAATNAEGDMLGDVYTFERGPMETVVTKGGVSVGTKAQVLYLGDLNSNPVSYRICTDDIYSSDDEADSDKADIIALKGTIEKVDQSVIYLKAGTYEFKFLVLDDATDLEKQAEQDVGREVEIAFSDSIRQRVMTADSITELN